MVRPGTEAGVRFLSSIASPTKLTHIDDSGRPQMVDVTGKNETTRRATAVGSIHITQDALDIVTNSVQDMSAAQTKALAKGDVLTTAQLAGIMAAKKTSELIPLCHPLPLSHVSVQLRPDPSTCRITCEAAVTSVGRTGVEMEALTAVSASLLTVWDMLKAVAGQDMTIGDIKVTSKTGGKADYSRA